MPVRDLRTCFVGDSFTAGVGDSTALGWTGRVSAAAIREGARQGYAFTGYNLGIRRDTSQDIAARIVAETTPRLSPAEDARVVLAFGVNDTTLAGHGHPQVSAEQTLQALRSIQRQMPATGLFFVGPPAIDNEEQNERIAVLDTHLSGLCRELDIPHVSSFSSTVSNPLWRQQVREGDGAHPDAGGYEILAGLIIPPLLAWLSQGSTDRG
nr:GDSL-type esterase/lipase family protein [Kineosporia babensis]